MPSLRVIFECLRQALGEVPWDVPFRYALRGLGKGLQALWRNKWVRRSVYGSCSLLVGVVVSYTLVIFNVFGLNTYSEGWQAGNLADYSMSNRMLQWMPPGSVFPTGEGDILLGNSSSRNATLNGRTISPAQFSTTAAMFQRNNVLVTQSVAIHFRQLRHTWFLNGETDIRVDRFQKTVPQTLPSSCSEQHGIGAKRIGVIGGNIVEVARVGNPWLWKTSEVLIHVGGNEFKPMSIVDESIYACAVIALQTGQPMKITYDDRLVRDPISQNTTYNLVGISNEQ